MTDMKRDELLIRLDEKLDGLSKQFSNHIKHHQKIAIAMIIIVGAFVAAGLARLLPWPF